MKEIQNRGGWTGFHSSKSAIVFNRNAGLPSGFHAVPEKGPALRPGKLDGVAVVRQAAQFQQYGVAGVVPSVGTA